MRRVVLDTNVLVSALLFGGIPARVTRLAIEGHILSATSPALLAELHGVLLAKFLFPSTIAEVIVMEWKTVSVVVEPTVEVSVIVSDPADNRVLECAVGAHADAIVSGDRHLLELQVFRGIPILSPHAFLEQWRSARH